MSNTPLERVKTWIAAHAAASAARDAEIAEHGFEVNDDRWLDVLALMPPVQEIAEGLVASAAEVERLTAERAAVRAALVDSGTEPVTEDMGRLAALVAAQLADEVATIARLEQEVGRLQSALGGEIAARQAAEANAARLVENLENARRMHRNAAP